MHKELYLSTLHEVSHLILKITLSSALLFLQFTEKSISIRTVSLLKVTGHSHITPDAMLITVMFLYSLLHPLKHRINISSKLTIPRCTTAKALPFPLAHHLHSPSSNYISSGKLHYLS